MLKYIVNLIFLILPPSPNRFKIFKRTLLRLAGNTISNSARFMRIRVQGCKLIVGDNTFIGDETMIMGSSGSFVIIGKDCDVSSRVNIITGTHLINPTSFKRAAGKGYGKNISIGDGVWIGFGAVILPGVTIGDGAIIGAGSVVTRDIPINSIWAGNPAREIKKRSNE